MSSAWDFSALAWHLLSAVWTTFHRSLALTVQDHQSLVQLSASQRDLPTTQTQQLFPQFRKLMHWGVLLLDESLQQVWSSAQDHPHSGEGTPLYYACSLNVCIHRWQSVMVSNSSNFPCANYSVTGTPAPLVNLLNICQSQWQKLSSKTYLPWSWPETIWWCSHGQWTVEDLTRVFC